MLARLTFLGIVAFWLTMNAMLWRSEFGVHGGDTPVPTILVWHKILTAPDASSLSVYQKGERMGYCEISTGVGQQMATFDEGKPPPEGFVGRGGYQLHVAGNVSMGDFTNRLKFDCRARFNHARQLEEITVKITSRTALIEVHSLATNQTAHFKLTNDGSVVMERDIPFADLQDPGTLIQTLTGNTMPDFFGLFGFSDLLPGGGAQKVEWDARRTRVKIGTEAVPVYQLETTVLGRPVTMDVSTLGEILRVELPGEISAHIDEWTNKS
jgi:hypothetical protein